MGGGESELKLDPHWNGDQRRGGDDGEPGGAGETARSVFAGVSGIGEGFNAAMAFWLCGAVAGWMVGLACQIPMRRTMTRS
jgi:hypothetical protein